MQLSKLLYQSIFWRGINLASVFILNIIVARLLGAVVYGNLFFIINFYSLALLLSSLSLESALGFYTAKGQLTAPAAGSLSVAWSAMAAVVITGILLLPGISFLQQYQASACYAFLFLSGNLLISFFTNLFTAQQQYIYPNSIVAITNLVLCALLLWFINSSEGSHTADAIHYYYLSFFIEGVLMAIAYFIIAGRKAGVITNAKHIYRKVFKYSLQAYFGNVIFFLVYRVDYWFVNYYSTDKTALGNYIQVCKLVQLFFIIPSIIAATVFSVTAAGHEGVMKKNIQQLSRIIFSGVLLACAVIAATGKWLFPFMFGSSFTQMYIPFLLLIPGIAAIATLYCFNAFYAGVNSVKRNVIGSAVALLVIVAGDLLLVPVAGIKGAAAVSSMGYVAYEIYILLQFKKEYGLKLADCFILKKEDLTLLMRLVNPIKILKN